MQFEQLFFDESSEHELRQTTSDTHLRKKKNALHIQLAWSSVVVAGANNMTPFVNVVLTLKRHNVPVKPKRETSPVSLQARGHVRWCFLQQALSPKTPGKYKWVSLIWWGHCTAHFPHFFKIDLLTSFFIFQNICISDPPASIKQIRFAMLSLAEAPSEECLIATGKRNTALMEPKQ